MYVQIDDVKTLSKEEIVKRLCKLIEAPSPLTMCEMLTMHILNFELQARGQEFTGLTHESIQRMGDRYENQV